MIGGAVLLFGAGVFIGRAGAPDPSANAAPARLVGFDADAIQLLDASLELRPIPGFDERTRIGSDADAAAPDAESGR